MSPQRSSFIKRVWLVLIMLVFGSLLGVWHNKNVNAGSSDPITSAFRAVLSPPSRMIGSFFSWSGKQISWIFKGRGMASENDRLKSRVVQLEAETASLKDSKINLDRLRQDLGFTQTQTPKPIAAEIINRSPDPRFDTLVINVGEKNGVKSNSVVRSPGGLVGRVFEVTPTSASVLLLTDQNSGVGVRVLRSESRVEGVCKGGFGKLLDVLYLSSAADVMVGDDMVTSGLGGVYPAGILVGKVVKIQEDRTRALKIAKVQPSALLSSITEVYVLP